LFFNLALRLLGTLDRGHSADFVVLDANPLDDIANTKKIARVYLRGREIDRAALRGAFSK
jgi:imidazolonepropionase-like amidohydrolase